MSGIFRFHFDIMKDAMRVIQARPYVDNICVETRGRGNFIIEGWQTGKLTNRRIVRCRKQWLHRVRGQRYIYRFLDSARTSVCDIEKLGGVHCGPRHCAFDSIENAVLAKLKFNGDIIDRNGDEQLDVIPGEVLTIFERIWDDVKPSHADDSMLSNTELKAVREARS